MPASRGSLGAPSPSLHVYGAETGTVRHHGAPPLSRGAQEVGYGDRHTVVKDRRKPLRTGTLLGMCRQLGIDPNHL